MNKLIIDVASEKIFLMIITNNDIYNIIYENTKINYEKLTTIINDFLKTKNLEIKDISKIYVNRGPGSFAGIRNSLSVVKAFNIAKKIWAEALNIYNNSPADLRVINDTAKEIGISR